MKILYEDKYLIVCEKPIGVESQLSSAGKPDMITLLSEYRKEKGEDSYVGLVHRLDTATGGAMIYSKQENVTGKISGILNSPEYEKEYLAIVHGAPEQSEGELRDLLYHDKNKNKSYVVDRDRKGVKEAIAQYKLIDSLEDNDNGKISLVKVRLITGRTHQIRVQFASRGMSLLGDGKYGSRDNKASLALWSHRLSFVHPITKKKIEVTSEPPRDYPWSLFEL